VSHYPALKNINEEREIVFRKKNAQKFNLHLGEKGHFFPTGEFFPFSFHPDKFNKIANKQ